MSAAPRVSAVIPTHGRPEQVVAAVRSALTQTVRDLEVVVVVDGPDPATERALAAVGDARVRVEVLPENRGQCAATNAGIARARGRWVALLDDDDTWLPDKLERQIDTAARADATHPVVGGRVIARGDAGDELWPRRAPRPGEPASEYLFCRTHPLWGERLFQSSVIFAERALFARVPFREELPRHSDLDWVVRAGAEPGVALLFPPGPEPVAVWSLGGGHARASRAPDWRRSLAWVRGLGPAVTPRAYAGFCLTWLAANAVEQGERRACATLLREALRHGRPGAVELAVFAAIWALPRRAREGLSRRGRGAGGAGDGGLG